MIDLQPLVLSFEVAVVATALAGVCGVGLAGLLSARKFRGRELIDAAVTAPMVLPPTVLGYYALVLLGRTSPLGHAFEQLFGSAIVFTRTGAVFAAGLGALPLITRSARSALEAVDARLLGAARSLGAGPLRAFLTVHLPLAGRGIAAGVMLGFARALGDFGVTLMIAGNIPGYTRTASLAIYDAVLGGREDEAMVISVIMVALAVVVLVAAGVLTEQLHDEL